ncbi:MAG: hypothetical protein V3R50_04165, partial [Gammaproteobacteria bacterium]
RHGFDADAVALRFFGEELVVENLQLDKAGNDTAAHQEADDRGKRDAPDEQASFGVMVLDWWEQPHDLTR